MAGNRPPHADGPPWRRGPHHTRKQRTSFGRRAPVSADRQRRTVADDLRATGITRGLIRRSAKRAAPSGRPPLRGLAVKGVARCHDSPPARRPDSSSWASPTDRTAGPGRPTPSIKKTIAGVGRPGFLRKMPGGWGQGKSPVAMADAPVSGLRSPQRASVRCQVPLPGIAAQRHAFPGSLQYLTSSGAKATGTVVAALISFRPMRLVWNSSVTKPIR